MTQWPENNSPPVNVAGARLKLLAVAAAAFGVVALGAYGFATDPAPQPKPVPQADTGIIRTTPDMEAQKMPPPVEGAHG
jgi:hypothetical protein